MNDGEMFEANLLFIFLNVSSAQLSYLKLHNHDQPHRIRYIALNPSYERSPVTASMNLF